MESFKDLAQALQSIVTSICLIAGGLWAYFKYFRFDSAKRAYLDIIESEQRLIEQQPVLNIAIKWDLLGGTQAANKAIGVTVTFINAGRRIVKLEDIKLKLKFVNSDQIIDSVPLYLSNGQVEPDLSYRLLRPGQSRNIAFPVENLVSGVCRVQISAYYSEFKELKNISENIRIYAAEQIVASIA